ncbi:hypothetical protein B0H19DRAFT_1248359 [Mycena capillaripes]|nr:hypothetical protein B0H19DRAFT_1248359 [Mycena capillaripes]
MSSPGSQTLGEDSELTAYPGNCHCGAFKFIVKLPNLNHIFSCNCSLCSRNAYLWAHPASKDDFIVVQGEGGLKDYPHGTNNHKFLLKDRRPQDGILWAYPPKDDVIVHTQDSLVEYMFGRNIIVHGFCGVCSVHVWEKFLSPVKAHTIGLNTRAINGFNFAELPTKVHNGKATMPQYGL